MKAKGDSKRRMLKAAGDLFRRQGYHGTGLKQVINESGAPRGSLYFHFPGGKGELAAEAVATSADQIGAGIEYLLDTSEDAGEAVAQLATLLAEELRRSDWERGCPVAGVALDMTTSSPAPVREACEAAFDDWVRKIEAKLRDAEWGESEARERSLLAISAIEGALLLARSSQDTGPLESVAHQLRPVLHSPPAEREASR